MVKLLIILDLSRARQAFETNSLELTILIITEWWSVLWKKCPEFAHNYFFYHFKTDYWKKSVENFDFWTKSISQISACKKFMVEL